MNYASRMPERQKLVKRLEPVRHTTFSSMLDDFKRRGQFSSKLYDSYEKRRTIEQQHTGKGQYVDELS